MSRRLTDAAHLLAGINPEHGYFEAHTRNPSWTQHCMLLDQQWADLERVYLRPARAWRNRYLRYTAKQSLLLYPFSGPDILNARVFFPNSNCYVMFGLEDPGRLPDLAAMAGRNLDSLLQDIRSSLKDMMLRNFFVSRHMMRDLRTHRLTGTIVLLLVFLGRTKCRINSVERIWLTSAGHVVIAASDPPQRHRMCGVRIVFRTGRDHPLRTIEYFALDAENSSLAQHPEFREYIRRTATGAVLLKAASYCLHEDVFSDLRALILDAAVCLVQEDSGVPFSLLRSEDWNVRLFGRYTTSISDFPGRYQGDLDHAYRTVQHKPLPFPFGYHWNDGYSNIQVARRVKPLPRKRARTVDCG